MNDSTGQGSPAAAPTAGSPSIGNQRVAAARPQGATKENLTEQEKLIRRLPEPAPHHDHYLLVFKRSGKELRLLSSLRPGEPYRKPFFTSPESLIAYIVPTDQNLRYRFSPLTFKSHDQLHSFTLQLTLEYRVSDPVTLVQKRELDPLGSIVKEIESFLEQRIKSLDWPAVEHERIDLEEVLFRRPDSSDRDQTSSGYERLRSFASLRGLGIQRIAVVRELPEEEIQVAATVLQSSRAEQIIAHEHGPRALRQGLEIDLDDQRQGARRRNELGDEVAKGIAHAFRDSVHTLDDVKPNVAKLAAIQPMITGVVPGAASPGLPSALSALSPAPTGFLPPTDSAATPLGALLAEIISVLGGLACDPGERKRLLSFALHVTAEALRGEDARPEALDPYAGAIRGMFDSLFPALSKDQVKLLRRLQDSEALKKEFG